MIFVVTGRSGRRQLWNARLVVVPTFSGEGPLWVPLGMLPDADEAGVVPLLVQVTLTPRLLSTVLVALAVNLPPLLILTVSVVLRGIDARADAAHRPTTAADVAAVANSRLPVRFRIVMNPPPCTRLPDSPSGVRFSTLPMSSLLSRVSASQYLSNQMNRSFELYHKMSIQLLPAGPPAARVDCDPCASETDGPVLLLLGCGPAPGPSPADTWL